MKKGYLEKLWYVIRLRIRKKGRLQDSWIQEITTVMRAKGQSNNKMDGQGIMEKRKECR